MNPTPEAMRDTIKTLRYEQDLWVCQEAESAADYYNAAEKLIHYFENRLDTMDEPIDNRADWSRGASMRETTCAVTGPPKLPEHTPFGATIDGKTTVFEMGACCSACGRVKTPTEAHGSFFGDEHMPASCKREAPRAKT